MHEYPRAIEQVKRILDRDPRDIKAHTSLAYCYAKTGRGQLGRYHLKEADRIATGHCNYTTRQNYAKIKDILDKKGIRLVCMQYPMRNIKPLRRIFSGQNGVIFVDNEKIFKEATSREGMDEYFIDMFGGNFGHCTAKGNRLLATNAADVILRECFGK
jgi:hypothetical protein